MTNIEHELAGLRIPETYPLTSPNFVRDEAKVIIQDAVERFFYRGHHPEIVELPMVEPLDSSATALEESWEYSQEVYEELLTTPGVFGASPVLDKQYWVTTEIEDEYGTLRTTMVRPNAYLAFFGDVRLRRDGSVESVNARLAFGSPYLNEYVKKHVEDGTKVYRKIYYTYQ